MKYPRIYEKEYNNCIKTENEMHGLLSRLQISNIVTKIIVPYKEISDKLKKSDDLVEQTELENLRYKYLSLFEDIYPDIKKEYKKYLAKNYNIYSSKDFKKIVNVVNSQRKKIQLIDREKIYDISPQETIEEVL